MSRFWVGGATGFLGSHLVRQLRADGHEVVAVSLSGGQVDDLPVSALDILEPAQVQRSAAGCDGAFLATGLVSRDRDAAERLHRVHVLGTRHALSGLRAAGVRRVVVASTSGTVAVGREPERIYDERDSAPLDLIARWPYYRTKLYGEREALAAVDPEFEVVIANPSLLLGPGDLRESSTGDVRKFLEGQILAIPRGGIAFVDVRDAARGLVRAFEHGKSGERYLMNGCNMTLAAFFARLSRLTRVPMPWLRLPSSPALAIGVNQLFSKAVKAIGGEPPVDEVSVQMSQYFWYCDSTKAETELGFSARDPSETLRDTVADLVERRVVVRKELRQFRADSAASF